MCIVLFVFYSADICYLGSSESYKLFWLKLETFDFHQEFAFVTQKNFPPGIIKIILFLIRF